MSNTNSLILFGTQTGTAEDLANELQEAIVESGGSSTCESMFDVSVNILKEYQQVFVIVSTWGDGDPPDDAEGFHLSMQELESGSLSHLSFAVFGLGDSGYDEFCKCGIDFDQFLEHAGATRLLDRVDCDIDFDEPFEEWLEKALPLAIETPLLCES